MKNTLLSAILLSAGLLQAQNLIKNGDFDKPLDQESIRPEYSRKTSHGTSA